MTFSWSCCAINAIFYEGLDNELELFPGVFCMITTYPFPRYHYRDVVLLLFYIKYMTVSISVRNSIPQNQRMFPLFVSLFLFNFLLVGGYQLNESLNLFTVLPGTYSKTRLNKRLHVPFSYF